MGGLTRCLQIPKSWGVKCRRPEDKFLSDPPESNCQEPAPLPEAVKEFTVDISQPRFLDFVDESHGSELRKWRSMTGRVFTFAGGVIARKSNPKRQQHLVLLKCQVHCCLHCCQGCLMPATHPPGTWIPTRWSGGNLC